MMYVYNIYCVFNFKRNEIYEYFILEENMEYDKKKNCMNEFFMK